MLQTLYAMPYLVSPIVIGYLWTLLLSPTFGPVNTLLTSIGLESWALPWLGDPDTALWVVILVSVWQWIGFPVLLYGAALGGVPEELSEAARVDGATHLQAFRRITFPLLVPAIGTVSVLTFIFAMEAFALPYAFGGSTGNPAGATDFLSLLFYRTAFDSGATDAIGTSSALATLLFVLIFGGAFAATAVLRRHETEDHRMSVVPAGIGTAADPTTDDPDGTGAGARPHRVGVPAGAAGRAGPSAAGRRACCSGSTPPSRSSPCCSWSAARSGATPT